MKNTSRSRRFALGVAIWVFGIATSVLLGSLWGRAVAGDPETLSAAATAAVNADWVARPIADWLGNEVAEHSGLPADETSAAVLAVLEQPAAQEAVADLVSQGMAAGLAPPGSTVVIDPAASMEPLAGEIAAGLTAAGVPASPRDVAELIDGIDPVTAVAAPGERAGSVSRTRALLSRAVFAAALTMLAAALAALALTQDRIGVLRALAARLALTALGFAVILRASAWALDPSGGATPLRRSGALLLASNGATLWWVAAAAAIPVAVLTAGRMRRGSGSPPAPVA